MAESPRTYPREREAVRVKCSISAEAVCVTRDGLAITEDWTTGRLTSLCSGGACFEAAIGAADGDVVCLRFSMPDTEEQMNLYGRVVNASGGAVSIKFVGLSLEESAKLLRYAFRQQIRIAKNQADPAEQGGPVEDEALVIPENIRRTTIPIMLDANTEVMGTVLSGARVRVAGDIRISGNVQDADITAVGSVAVDGGFLGVGAGRIACGGDFKARFVQNQRIEAAGNVTVEKSIISSTVMTSGDVVVGPDEGAIVGGEIHAYGKVEASVIGSPRPVTTRIYVGSDPLVRLAIDAMERRALELTTRRVCLVKRIAFAAKHPGKPSGSDDLADLEAASVAIQAELAKIGEEVVRQRMKSHMRPDAVVVVHEAAHPPLDVSICTYQVVSDSGTGPVVFRLLEDRVVLDTWSLR
jgi:Flagellar Assembly Protein A beta solenoid domain/PilZ domain